LPLAISVQVLRARVVVIRMLPALRIENRAIAALIPFVEGVSARGVRGLILRTVGALNRDELPAVNARAPLRFGNFRLALTDNYLRFGIPVDLNAIVAVAQRVHGGIRSVDFGVRLAVLEDAVIHQALADLQLNVRGGKVRDLDGRIFVEADHVGVVELNFRAPAIAGRDAVAGFERCVERAGNPVRRVASLHGNISVNHAQAPHCGLHLRSVLIILILALIRSTLDLRVTLALISILRAGRSSHARDREEDRYHNSQMLFHGFHLAAGITRSRPSAFTQVKARAMPNFARGTVQFNCIYYNYLWAATRSFSARMPIRSGASQS